MTKASTIRPEGSRAHLLLGRIFEITGENDSAADEFRKAAGLDPGGPDGREADGALRRLAGVAAPSPLPRETASEPFFVSFINKINPLSTPTPPPAPG